MKTTHKVILGDCLEKLKEIPDESVDLVFADPPYNMSKKKGLGWKYSKHITMQEGWDIFTKDEFFQFNVKWIKECMADQRKPNLRFHLGSLLLGIKFF